jgi:WD40 repeat protein
MAELDPHRLFSLDGRFSGHPGPVTALAFRPDGKTLVSAGVDGMLRFWDTRSWTAQREPVAAHDDTVLAVAFSSDGELLAVAGHEALIRVWHARSLTLHSELPVPGSKQGVPAVNALCFLPDGHVLAAAGHDGVVRLWEVDRKNSDPVLKLECDGQVLRALAHWSDGTLAAAGDEGAVWHWDRQGKPLGSPFVAHLQGVRALAFTDSVSRLATAGPDGLIRRWSLPSGLSHGAPISGHDGQVMAMARGMLRGLPRIATAGADTTVRVWDPTFSHRPAVLTGHVGPVLSVAFSPIAPVIASAGLDGTVRLWDGSVPLATIRTGHRSAILAVAYSPDGSRIASAGDEAVIRVWHADTGILAQQVVIGHQRRIRALSYSPDGTQLASGGVGGTVRIWDAGTGEQIGETLAAHGKGIRALAFAPGPGRARLASAGDDGTVRIWDLRDFQQVSGPLAGHGPGCLVLAVAFSPDGKLVAESGSDGKVMVWNEGADSRTLRYELSGVHEVAVRSVAFSPDGGLLATGGNDGAIALWDLATGRVCAECQDGHASAVRVVLFAANGRVLASAGNDGRVRLWLWDSESLKPLGKPLHGRDSAVRALAFSPDSRRIVAGGYDGALHIWDTELYTEIPAPAPGTVETDSDGGLDPTGAEDGRTRLAPLARLHSDAPSEQDLLEVIQDVRRLARTIAATHSEPPLAIALLGVWGSGKSTMILHMDREVETLSSDARAHPGRTEFMPAIRQVHFNAWHYNDDHVWTGLAEKILPAFAPFVPDPAQGAASDRIGLFRLRLRVVLQNALIAAGVTLLILGAVRVIPVLLGTATGVLALVWAALNMITTFFDIVDLPTRLSAFARGGLSRAHLMSARQASRRQTTLAEALRNLREVSAQTDTTHYKAAHGLLGQIRADLERLDAARRKAFLSRRHPSAGRPSRRARAPGPRPSRIELRVP